MIAPRESVIRVVLAGVGGDSHSVGISVLRMQLESAGYFVDYLGIQRSVSEICESAMHADAVMVSNMDGHAMYYLEHLKSAQSESGTEDRLWYLGGYPTMRESLHGVDALARLGFSRVFQGYTDTSVVLAQLEVDLATRPSTRGLSAPTRQLDSSSPEVTESDDGWNTIRNESTSSLTTPADSNLERDRVLSGWHTGHAATLREENASRLLSCRSLAISQDEAQALGRPLLQARTGVSSLKGQAKLFDAMLDAGADVLSFQIDSLTRNGAYEDVGRVLKEDAGPNALDSLLNGFPLVNHGVDALSELTAMFAEVPLQVRHSARDPRLLAEVAFAAGIGAFEGGAISYNFPYYRDYPISESLRHWQYVDELTGDYFHDHGAIIDREFFGVLTACQVPPCIAIVVDVLEALLAAQRGVRSVSLGYAEQGNRYQDLAAIQVLREVASDRLTGAGYLDVSVHCVWHQFMGPFPSSREKARELIQGSIRNALTSGATRILLKTPVEAHQIPGLVDNQDVLRIARAARDYEARIALPGDKKLDFEKLLLRREVDSILDCILDAAPQNLPRAVEVAVQMGWIDIPFSPNRQNRGSVVSVRDEMGAIRLADPGSLPLPDDVTAFHAEAVATRRRDGSPVGSLIEADMVFTAFGRFDTWPLE